MRNKELAIKKIEQIENRIQIIGFQISRDTEIKNVYSTITQAKELLEELKTVVNRD